MQSKIVRPSVDFLKSKTTIPVIVCTVILTIGAGWFLRAYNTVQISEAKTESLSPPSYVETRNPQSLTEPSALFGEVAGDDAEQNTLEVTIPSSTHLTSQKQEVNGVFMTVANFRLENNQLLVDTCFDLPDNGDWSIWDVTLKLRDREIKGTGGFPVETPIEPTHQTPQRCDTIYFDGLTANTDFLKTIFVVERILAYPREGEECSPAYLAKYQKALDERNTGITVECFIEELGGGGMSGVRVAGKPETMSEEEANAILLDYNFFLDVHGIAGPWTFPFSLEQ